MSSTDCLFCRIASGEIPADVVDSTDDIVAFRDIHPQAPTHVLLIPRRHIPSLTELEPSDAEVIGGLFLKAAEIARREGIADGGYRTVINAGADGGQTVFHVHLHLLGGRPLGWPPG